MVCGILPVEKKFTPNFFSCRANRSTLKKFQIFIIFLCVKFIPFRVLFFTRLELVLKGHFWTLGVVWVPPSQSLIKSWKNTPCLSVGDDSLKFYFRFLVCKWAKSSKSFFGASFSSSSQLENNGQHYYGMKIYFPWHFLGSCLQKRNSQCVKRS